MGGTVSKAFVVPVLLGIGLAVVGRIFDLFLGRRHLPTYPHGQVVHFFLGFVAGALGSLAVPALLTANVTAGVFLGIGTQQFHSVRGQERATLLNLDRQSRVPRGKTFIEDLVQSFEAQNFLAFGVALVTTLGAARVSLWAGVGIGLCALVVVRVAFRGRRVADIAEVVVEPDGEDQGHYTIRLRPHGPRSAAVLRDPGQRQAIAHDVHAMVGAHVSGAGEERLPEVEIDPRGGGLIVQVWPVEKDAGLLAQAASNVPVLESIAAPLKAASRGARA